MSFNRRRHPNAVPLASLASWILICAFLGGAGLYYVYCKNQLHETGRTIKRFERELAELTTQNEVVRAKLSSLSSHAALQRRLTEGFIKLVPITDDRIVRVGFTPAGGDDLRAVSHQKATE